MKIKTITPSDTWELRRSVMWPGKPLDYVKLEEDREGMHFGLYDNGELISVISLFILEGSAQFRKFATRADRQGKGYGTALLRFVFEECSRRQIKRVWCNAREDKSPFYEKFGMKVTKDRFSKGEINYVVMEKSIAQF